MASLPAFPSELEAGLGDAVRRRFGAGVRIEPVGQATLGGSNRTLIFDLVDGAARRRLVSREETFSGPANPFLAPACQFRVMTQAYASGIPAPEPVFQYDEGDAVGPGFVTAFVAGETLPRRLLADEASHSELLADLAGALARLHGVDTAQVGFLADLPESGDPIAAMRLRLDSLGEPHPPLEFGLRWLERRSLAPRAPVLLHGDFRNGNFMVANGRLGALLDWECAHLGSPAEDLGWLCTRSWRFGRIDSHAGGFGGRADLIRAYRDAGGADLSEDEVRWWEIYGLVRWAMYNILQAHGFAGGRRSPAYAACGRNTAFIEYDLLMTLSGDYD